LQVQAFIPSPYSTNDEDQGEFFRFDSMNYHEAQQEFAGIIKSTAVKVNAYLWRLSGDAPNSLCKFLGLEEEELKTILRLCRVYNADNNNSFSKNNFDLLMLICQPYVNWMQYRLNTRPKRFIRIGHGGEMLRPKDFYDANGSLFVYPVQDKNVPSLQAKLQKSTLMKLLAAGKNNEATTDEPPTQAKMKQDARSPNKTFSSKGLLLEYIHDIVIGAGERGDRKMPSRALSYLNQLVTSCVDVAAKDLLHAIIEKYAFEQDVVEGKQLVLSPPNPVAVLSSTPKRVVVDPVGVVIINLAVDFDGEVRQSPASFAVRPATHNENDPVLLAFDHVDVDALDDDESLIGTTTTTEFLSKLKEEVVLQSLLHKRIHEKKE
jgi:hypothetical protein